jgi:hypothetical protein
LSTLESATCAPDSTLATIERSVFGKCSSLESICIPRSVEVLDSRCFEFCTKLSSVVFCPDCQVLRIGDSAFTNCSSLSSIGIPSSVEILEDNCFENCTGLMTVTFESVRDIFGLVVWCFGSVAHFRPFGYRRDLGIWVFLFSGVRSWRLFRLKKEAVISQFVDIF